MQLFLLVFLLQKLFANTDHQWPIGVLSAFSGVICVILAFVPFERILKDSSKFGHVNELCIGVVALLPLIALIIAARVCFGSSSALLNLPSRVLAFLAYVLLMGISVFIGIFGSVMLVMMFTAIIVIVCVIVALIFGLTFLKGMLLTNSNGRYQCSGCGARFDYKPSTCPVCGAELSW